MDILDDSPRNNFINQFSPENFINPHLAVTLNAIDFIFNWSSRNNRNSFSSTSKTLSRIHMHFLSYHVVCLRRSINNNENNNNYN